jgi:hypothetical protein
MGGSCELSELFFVDLLLLPPFNSCRILLLLLLTLLFFFVSLLLTVMVLAGVWQDRLSDDKQSPYPNFEVGGMELYRSLPDWEM